MAQSSNEIGRSMYRSDGIDKVTASAAYTTGVVRPNMLHAKLLLSPLPHALIKSIDASRAERVSGVRAVVAARDILERLDCNLYFGSVFIDQPILAHTKVRHVGERVAAVVAEDLAAAEEAVGLIDVEYEELPPVLDVNEALADGAPLLHEKMNLEGQLKVLFQMTPVSGTNICNRHTINVGDIEAGFAASEHIFEGIYSTPPAQHCSMEPHVAIAEWQGDSVTLWSATQGPYAVKIRLATMFKIKPEQVRVVVKNLGGGFGAKSNLKIEPLVAALARLSGRPVKLHLSRKEEFYVTSKHAAEMYVKSGVSKDGKLLARYCKVLYDTGAYADTGPIVSMKAGYTAAGPYSIPNVSIDIYCLYTNKTPAGSLRGFGVSQVAWAHETHLDEIAHGLGIDPIEIRLNNAYPNEGVFVSGETLPHFHLIQALQDAAEASGWRTRARVRDEGGRLARGMGVACSMKNTASPTRSEAHIWLSPEGDIEVRTATVEMGQGAYTILAQMAGESLGLPAEQIRVAELDTDVAPFDVGTISSRSTFHMGNAVVAAADDLKRQLIEHAATLLEAAPRDLVVSNGAVSVADAPHRQVEFSALVQRLAPQAGLTGQGVFTTTSKMTTLEEALGDRMTPYWDEGASVAEVEVDRATGKVRVLRYVCATDAGRAINPALCKQQIAGEILMGIGMTFFEHMRYEGGQLLNPSYVDYKIPSLKDTAGRIDIVLGELGHPDGPFGAKGIGEVAVPQVAPAIANAIFDAVGVRLYELPLTPERVLAALRKQAHKE